jgi:hypothetical protein
VSPGEFKPLVQQRVQENKHTSTNNLDALCSPELQEMHAATACCRTDVHCTAHEEPLVWHHHW